MNIPLDRKLRLPAPRVPSSRVEEATVVALGRTLSAVFVDRPAGGRARMQAEQDGLPLPRPFVAAELALRSEWARHVVLVPQAAEALVTRRLLLRLGSLPVAEIDPGWLQPPQDDLPALAAQLNDQGFRRLLRMMLTTGASLFAGVAQAELADAVPRLLDIRGIPALAPVAETRLSGRMLVSYAAPGLSGPCDLTKAVALAQGRPVPVAGLEGCAEDGLLHVLFPAGLAPARIVTLGEVPLHLAPAGAALRRLAPADWMKGRGGSCRDWIRARAGRNAAGASGERRPARSPAPQITIRHLSSVAGGVLYALALEDPARAAGQVVLDRGGRQVELAPWRGPDGTVMLTGLAELPGASQDGGTCRVRVLDHSGRPCAQAEAPLSPYDGSIPPAFEEAWTLGADSLAPLARARAGLRRPAPPSTTQRFGAAQGCRLRIVTPVGGSSDLIRARAAMILAESRGRGTPVEVVCTMTEGPLAVGARHVLAQAAELYGIPHRLVLLPGFATPAERLRAALAEARGLPALVLGADVLPDRPGWLSFWLRRLGRREALAPALLASDGAIAATGEGADPCRGLPADRLPASGRLAARPLADCLALDPRGIARLLDAAGAPHPDPALWIAATLEGVRTETRFPFRRFGAPAAPGAFAAALADAGHALIGKDRG